jgi:hypothetical protein
MRPTPPPTATTQTPALPGFRVYGDAKITGFETFGSSPGIRSNRLNPCIPDASALEARTERSATMSRHPFPFERVQTDSRIERTSGAESLDPPQTVALFERVQMKPSGFDSVSHRRRRSMLLPFERVQTAVRTLGNLGCTVCLHSCTRLVHSSRAAVDPSETQGHPCRHDRGTSLPFERVQMPTPHTRFSARPRPPHWRHQPVAPRALHARLPPTTQEETPMPPPQ